MIAGDGDVLVVASPEGPFQRWRIASRSRLGEPIGMGADGARLSAAKSTKDYISYHPSNPDDRRIHYWSSKRPHQQFETEALTGEVSVASLSSDGRLVASFTRGVGIELWERRSRRALTRIVTNTEDPVTDLAFTPDATRIAAVTAGGLLRVWSLSSPGGMQGELWGHQSEVSAIQFSSDGDLLSGAADGKIAIWNLDGMVGRGPWHTISEGGIRDFSVSRDRKRLLAVVDDGTLHKFDQEVRLPLHVVQLDDTPAGILTTPDWKQALVWSDSGALSLYDTRTLSRETLKNAPTDVRAATLSPDGQQMVFITLGGGIKVWSISAQNAVTEWRPSVAPSGRPVFSATGKWLAVGAEDGTVTIFSTESWDEVQRFPASDRAVMDMVFNGDDSHLITAGSERVLRIWDTSNWQVLAEISTTQGQIKRLGLSADGRRLAGVAQSGGVPVWDLSLLGQSGEDLLKTFEQRWGVGLQSDVMRVGLDTTWKPAPGQ